MCNDYVTLTVSSVCSQADAIYGGHYWLLSSIYFRLPAGKISQCVEDKMVNKILHWEITQVGWNSFTKENICLLSNLCSSPSLARFAKCSAGPDFVWLLINVYYVHVKKVEVVPCCEDNYKTWWKQYTSLDESKRKTYYFCDCLIKTKRWRKHHWLMFKG